MENLVAVPGGWMIEGDDNIYFSQADALAVWS